MKAMANWEKGITGNAAIFSAAHALTTANFNVLLTSRNMKGPDLIAISENDNVYQIQVKGFKAAIQDVSLAKGLDRPTIREPNWIFVCQAMSITPVIYVLNRNQITEYVGQDSGFRSGKSAEERQWWIGIRKPIKAGVFDHSINNFANLI
jgi:hypothetical protein